MHKNINIDGIHYTCWNTDIGVAVRAQNDLSVEIIEFRLAPNEIARPAYPVEIFFRKLEPTFRKLYPLTRVVATAFAWGLLDTAEKKQWKNSN